MYVCVCICVYSECYLLYNHLNLVVLQFTLSFDIVAGWDVKHFTNCRLAMMGWPLLLLCYAYKQHETIGLSDSMFVSVALQLVYITKFFFWEMGYMRSLDIMHDRSGWYLVSCIIIIVINIIIVIIIIIIIIIRMTCVCTF